MTSPKPTLIIPFHLVGLVTEKTPGGAWICVHGKQLTICAECGKEADRRFKEYSHEQH